VSKDFVAVAGLTRAVAVDVRDRGVQVFARVEEVDDLHSLRQRVRREIVPIVSGSFENADQVGGTVSTGGTVAVLTGCQTVMAPPTK